MTISRIFPETCAIFNKNIQKIRFVTIQIDACKIRHISLQLAVFKYVGTLLCRLITGILEKTGRRETGMDRRSATGYCRYDAEGDAQRENGTLGE
jgi:hypothetical protein